MTETQSMKELRERKQRELDLIAKLIGEAFSLDQVAAIIARHQTPALKNG